MTEAMKRQIARLKAWRAKFMADQEARMQEESRRKGLDKEAERARIKALRRPPAKVWRIGRTLLWEPPETFDQLKPAGFWVSEKAPGGNWYYHGDYQPNDTREAQLYGDGPARVEAYYDDMAGPEHYYSPVVEATPGEFPYLVSRVRYYCTCTDKGEEYVNRFRRVLAALGVVETKRGHASRPPVSPLNPPMSAAEAEELTHLGITWDRIADVLWRLEGGEPPPPPPTRMDKIVDATRTYTGRRTIRRRMPWVRPLRRHAGMPDITTKERTEAHQRAQEG